MVEAFLYARTCARHAFSDEELISVCYLALTRAANNFNQRKIKGRVFFSYAKLFIRGHIKKEWKKLDAVRNGGRTDILDASSLPELKHSHDTWLENGGEPTDFEDTRPAQKQIRVDNSTEMAALHSKETWTLLRPVIFKHLNDYERLVIDLRYRAEFAFEKIGDLLQISRQAIEHVHAKALHKLRTVLQDKKELFK